MSARRFHFTGWSYDNAGSRAARLPVRRISAPIRRPLFTRATERAATRGWHHKWNSYPRHVFRSAACKRGAGLALHTGKRDGVIRRHRDTGEYYLHAKHS